MALALWKQKYIEEKKKLSGLVGDIAETVAEKAIDKIAEGIGNAITKRKERKSRRKKESDTNDATPKDGDKNV